jgi:hypothetical protein
MLIRFNILYCILFYWYPVKIISVISKRLILTTFAYISPLQGLFLELAIFLQIFTRRCRLKKLQSSKIFVESKSQGQHKAAEQRNICHIKILIFYRPVMFYIVFIN